MNDDSLLVPLVNADADMTDDMRRALNWFCTMCRMEGTPNITGREVRAFLRDVEKRPDLADRFSFTQLHLQP